MVIPPSDDNNQITHISAVNGVEKIHISNGNKKNRSGSASVPKRQNENSNYEVNATTSANTYNVSNTSIDGQNLFYDNRYRQSFTSSPVQQERSESTNFSIFTKPSMTGASEVIENTVEFNNQRAPLTPSNKYRFAAPAGSALKSGSSRHHRRATVQTANKAMKLSFPHPHQHGNGSPIVMHQNSGGTNPSMASPACGPKNQLDSFQRTVIASPGNSILEEVPCQNAEGMQQTSEGNSKEQLLNANLNIVALGQQQSFPLNFITTETGTAGVTPSFFASNLAVQPVGSPAGVFPDMFIAAQMVQQPLSSFYGGGHPEAFKLVNPTNSSSDAFPVWHRQRTRAANHSTSGDGGNHTIGSAVSPQLIRGTTLPPWKPSDDGHPERQTWKVSNGAETYGNHDQRQLTLSNDSETASSLSSAMTNLQWGINGHSMAAGIAVTPAQTRRLAPTLKNQSTPLVSASVVGFPVLSVGSPSVVSTTEVGAPQINDSWTIQKPDQGSPYNVPSSGHFPSSHSESVVGTPRKQARKLTNTPFGGAKQMIAKANQSIEPDSNVTVKPLEKPTKEKESETPIGCVEHEIKTFNQKKQHLTNATKNENDDLNWTDLEIGHSSSISGRSEILNSINGKKTIDTPALFSKGQVQVGRMTVENSKTSSVYDEQNATTPSNTNNESVVGFNGQGLSKTRSNGPIQSLLRLSDVSKKLAERSHGDWWFPSKKGNRFGNLHVKVHRLRRRITSWSPPASRRERKLWEQAVMSQAADAESRRIALLQSVRNSATPPQTDFSLKKCSSPPAFTPKTDGQSNLTARDGPVTRELFSSRLSLSSTDHTSAKSSVTSRNLQPLQGLSCGKPEVMTSIQQFSEKDNTNKTSDNSKEAAVSAPNSASTVMNRFNENSTRKSSVTNILASIPPSHTKGPTRKFSCCSDQITKPSAASGSINSSNSTPDNFVSDSCHNAANSSIQNSKTSDSSSLSTSVAVFPTTQRAPAFPNQQRLDVPPPPPAAIASNVSFVPIAPLQQLIQTTQMGGHQWPGVQWVFNGLQSSHHHHQSTGNHPQLSLVQQPQMQQQQFSTALMIPFPQNPSSMTELVYSATASSAVIDNNGASSNSNNTGAVPLHSKAISQQLVEINTAVNTVAEMPLNRQSNQLLVLPHQTPHQQFFQVQQAVGDSLNQQHQISTNQSHQSNFPQPQLAAVIADAEGNMLVQSCLWPPHLNNNSSVNTIINQQQAPSPHIPMAKSPVNSWWYSNNSENTKPKQRVEESEGPSSPSDSQFDKSSKPEGSRRVQNVGLKQALDHSEASGVLTPGSNNSKPRLLPHQATKQQQQSANMQQCPQNRKSLPEATGTSIQLVSQKEQNSDEHFVNGQWKSTTPTGPFQRKQQFQPTQQETAILQPSFAPAIQHQNIMPLWHQHQRTNQIRPQLQLQMQQPQQSQQLQSQQLQLQLQPHQLQAQQLQAQQLQAQQLQAQQLQAQQLQAQQLQSQQSRHHQQRVSGRYVEDLYHQHQHQQYQHSQDQFIKNHTQSMVRLDHHHAQNIAFQSFPHHQQQYPEFPATAVCQKQPPLFNGGSTPSMDYCPYRLNSLSSGIQSITATPSSQQKHQQQPNQQQSFFHNWQRNRGVSEENYNRGVSGGLSSAAHLQRGACVNTASSSIENNTTNSSGNNNNLIKQTTSSNIESINDSQITAIAEIPHGRAKLAGRSIAAPQSYFHFWCPSTTFDKYHLDGISKSISLSIKHFVVSVDQEIKSQNGPLKLRIVNSVKSEILRFLRKSSVVAKFLPSSRSPAHRRLANRSSAADGLDVLAYGSYCSNLYLPWSDIDLAITGLQFPALFESSSLPCRLSTTNMTAATSISSPSIASSSNENMTCSTTCSSTTPAQTQNSSQATDPRHEILQHMADFFDKSLPDVNRGKARKASNPLKCKTELLQQFFYPQFKPSRHTPLLTVNFHLSSDRSVSTTSHLDISILSGQHTGIEAIKLLKFYSTFFPTMRPLVLVLKQALWRRHINIPYEGGLSSYALSLMVIAFLQSPSLYNSRMHDTGYQLLNFLAFYADINVPSEGCLHLRPFASMKIQQPNSHPQVHQDSASYQDGGSTDSQNVERAEVRSFNYYSVAINVLPPDAFVQSQTFRYCLRLIDGRATASKNNLNPKADARQSFFSSCSITVSSSLKLADNTAAWPAVQEVHPVLCPLSSAIDTGNVGLGAKQTSTIVSPGTINVTPTENGAHTTAKEQPQSKAKLSYAAVARPGNPLTKQSTEEKHLTSAKLSTINKADAPSKLNIWKSGSVSLDLKKEQKRWGSLSEIRAALTEKTTGSTSTTSLKEFSVDSSASEISGVRPTSKSQPTSPCFKPLDFPLLNAEFDHSSCLLSTWSHTTQQIHNNKTYGQTQEDASSTQSEGSPSLLELPKKEIRREEGVMLEASCCNADGREEKKSEGATSSIKSGEETTASETIAETPPGESESTANTPGQATSLMEENEQLPSLDVILPIAAASSQSSLLFASVSPCGIEKWDLSLASDPSFATSSTETCSGDDSCPRDRQLTDSSNVSSTVNMTDWTPSSAPPAPERAPPNPSAALELSSQEPMVEVMPGGEHTESSDEPYWNEMFELLTAFPKVDNFMGHRLEIRDPFDATNNVGRPSFNVTGIRTAFANAYSDILRTPLCPTCSNDNSVDMPIKNGHWPSRNPPVSPTGDNLLKRQIEAWKTSIHGDLISQSITHESSSFANDRGSLGCIACCGALRCIV